MLTDDALRERRWGWLPTLRIVLEGKPDPSYHLDACTSDSDSDAEAFARMLQSAELAQRHQSEIEAAARRLGPQEMHEDIHRLESALRSAAAQFSAAATRVHNLHFVADGHGY